MKPTGTLLVLLAWSTALLAASQESAVKVSSKVSPHVSAMIKAELPGYTPPPAEPSATSLESSPVVTSDPAVLELEKVTVRERKPQKIEPLDILSDAGRRKKLALDFKDSLQGLDALLNGFSFPIFSPSMAERGRVYRQQQQLNELTRIGSAVRGADPKAAADLKKNAADAQRAIDQQNRPAGDD